MMSSGTRLMAEGANAANAANAASRRAANELQDVRIKAEPGK